MAQIALFPLQIVVYPGETLPLHIFEKRYRQLLEDVREQGVNFGIPPIVGGKMTYGTEIELVKTVKSYENGSADIVCKGKRVFMIEKFQNPLEGKLYAGGDVKFLNNIYDGKESARQKVLKLIKKLYKVMNVEMPEVSVDSFNSYTLAHKIGLSVTQELELLQLIYESERLKYLKAHLHHIIPVLKEVNRTKEIIKMNGHFRSFDPLDFKKIK